MGVLYADEVDGGREIPVRGLLRGQYEISLEIILLLAKQYSQEEIIEDGRMVFSSGDKSQNIRPIDFLHIVKMGGKANYVNCLGIRNFSITNLGGQRPFDP